LADSAEIKSAGAPLKHATARDGIIYVIDLVGFSNITDRHIATGARHGTENLTRIVTHLFTTLMEALSEFDIRYGGFAGDALIAWQPATASILSLKDFQALTERVCDDVLAGLSCRTAIAEGAFWMGNLDVSGIDQCLVWGPAVGAAFSNLNETTGTPLKEDALFLPNRPQIESNLATASVTERWAIVLRALSSDICDTAGPAAITTFLERTIDVCEAYSAIIDNVVQDDKGLLIVIVMPPSEPTFLTNRDALIDALFTGRHPLVTKDELGSEYGTIFTFQTRITNQTVNITIGSALNRAAKSLLADPISVNRPTSIPAPDASKHPRELIGRDVELKAMFDLLDRSSTDRKTGALIGEAGMGKSSLVAALIEQHGNDATLIEVTPGSRYLPFGAAQDLAERCGLPASAALEPKGQKSLAQQLPQILIIENWQWCDDDSKRLLRRLQNDRDRGLLLITSRSDLDTITADKVINVRPLSYERASQLIDEFAPDCLSDDLKHSVIEIASGTPFWLVQAALHYRTTNASGTHTPTLSGLETLLGARAQNLSAPAMALWRLHCAWRQPLTFERAKDLLARFEIDIVPNHFSELKSLGWLSSDATHNEDGHRPAHDILADWGGGDLPVSFERSLHAAIARQITASKGAAARIARHWEIAAQKMRAAIWYQRAAANADRAGAHRLTLKHISKSTALYGAAKNLNPVRELENLALSATATWGVGRLRRAKQDLLKFDQLVKTIPASKRKRKAVQRAGAIQSEVGQFAGNSKLIRSGLWRGWRASRQSPDAFEIKARRESFIYYALGLLRLPIDPRLKRTISRAHMQNEPRSETILGCAAGTLFMIRCAWDEAEDVLTSCHSTIAQTDDQQMLGVAQCLLGLCALFQGHTDPARIWFDRVAETGREYDHHLFKVWGAYAQAEAEFYAGNHTDALRLALQARQLSKGLGDHQSGCIIEGLLAQLYLARSNETLARKHARFACRYAAKIPPTNFSTLEGIAAPAYVGLMLKRDDGPDRDIDRMIASGRSALKAFARVFPMTQPRFELIEGLFAHRNRNTRSAYSWYQKAKSSAEKSGMAYELALANSAINSIQESPHGVPTKLY